MIFVVKCVPCGEDGSPCGVACDPGYARTSEMQVRWIQASTNNQAPIRQEGEAVALSSLWQVGDEAGVGGRAREDFDRFQVARAIPAAYYYLPWCKRLLCK